MFFWFVGTAVLTVWYVFRDPRFDYRLLVVGSVLPLGDALFAPGDGPGMRWMHSLAFSVALLVVVMAVTAGRKPHRKRLLGLPIGTFRWRSDLPAGLSLSYLGSVARRRQARP